MAHDWQTIPEKDFSQGVDKASSENQIKPGFVEDATNIDTTKPGTLTKRRGYQTFGGNMPFRVVSYREDSVLNQICFTLDGNVNLSTIRNQPIIVSGSTSVFDTKFTDAIDPARTNYYAETSSDIKVPFTGGSGTTQLPATTHGQAANLLFVGTAQSSVTFDNSNSQFLPDAVRIDKSTFDVDVDYTNSTGSEFSGFIWAKNKEAVTGLTYVNTDTLPDAAQTTINITQATHNLTNNNIGVALYEDTGAEYVRITPDSVTIAPNGDVDITATNNSGSPISIVYILTAVADANVLNGTVANGASQTIVIENIESPFLFVYPYLEDLNTQVQELVIPDSVVVDEAAGTATVTFTNNQGLSYQFTGTAANLDTALSANISHGLGATPTTLTLLVEQSPGVWQQEDASLYVTATDTELQDTGTTLTSAFGASTNVRLTAAVSLDANFFVYYEYADVLVNELCVSTPISTTVSDTRPQLTLWGLDHDGLYKPTAGDKAGWVQHVDSYKSTGERYLVAGLGGNLFSHRYRSEIGTSYLLPAYFPRLINRVNVVQNVGPAFSGYTVGHTRTRGTVQFTGGDDYLATCRTITWQSGNVVRYELEVPNLTLNGTLTDILVAGQDYLTVTEAGYKRNEGEFLIFAVSNPGGDILYVDVINSRINSSDWNETDSGAQCGVYTDSFTFLNPASFIPGDKLISGAFGEDSDIEVLNSFTDVGPIYRTTIRNVITPTLVPAGQRVVAERTSCVIPLRDGTNTANVDSIVPGDMLSFAGTTRLLRVKNVNTRSDTAVTITGNAVTGEATVVLGSGDTTILSVGERVTLVRANAFSGTYTIAGVQNETTFTISTDAAGTESGTLLGKHVCVDEVFTFRDDPFNGNQFVVDSRWIPVESPVTAYDLPKSTHVRHFDSDGYSEQYSLRSTMVQDSMFFTNGSDEVTKYDGVSLYRAGIPRWQPQLFMTVDEVNDRIVVKTDYVTVGPADNSSPETSTAIKVVNAGEATRVIAGDLVSLGGTIYTVARTDVDNDTIIFTASVPAATWPLHPHRLDMTFVNRYRYYFRLNAVDRNRNIVASAVTGASDNIVNLQTSSSVKLRLVGLPAWDIYDYDVLEVEIYRTQANTVGPFYRIVTLPISFNNGEGYIEYVDTSSDEELLDLDNTVTVLKGSELTTGLALPGRAKYITSSGNRLILANLADYPTLDVSLEGVSSSTELADILGSRWLFRKNNLDDDTDTDMLNRAAYVFTTNNLAATISAVTEGQSLTVTVGVGLPPGMEAGDWVYLFRKNAWTPATEPHTLGMGWHQVTSVAGNDFTVKDLNAPASVPVGDLIDAVCFVAAPGSLKDVPIYLDTDDYNYGMASGNFGISQRQIALRRFANAINVTMRVTNVEISGYESFEPWMIANAGSEYGAGQIVIRQPKVFDTTLELLLPENTSYTVFVNNTKRDTSHPDPDTSLRLRQVQAVTKLYPSRLIASYPNYPELFDSPFTVVDSESDSAIDINSADGQQITGVIPFFGESAFGSAQKDAVIVVFKTNSVYLVNLEAKRQGFNAVQKIDSQGLGCTYPYSIASTREGIMFANEAGVYRLSRNMTINYVGRMIERYWEESVDKDSLELAQGHNYALGRTYKLSYPLVGETSNSNVLVYDHTQEYQSQQGLGGWSIFNNHPVTGWANLDDSAYFASTKGRVFSLRQANDNTDYRDDDEAIEASITFRALDFGDAAIRKYVSNIMLYLRSPNDATGTKFYVATDLRDNFHELDEFKVEVEDTTDGISDRGLTKVVSIKFNTSRSKFTYLQNRLTNGNIDESLEVTGIQYRVITIGHKGLTDAARTTK